MRAVAMRVGRFGACTACVLVFVLAPQVWASASEGVQSSIIREKQADYLFLLTKSSRVEAERAAMGYARSIDATSGDVQRLGAFYREALLWRAAALTERQFVESIKKTRVNFQAPSDRILESVDGGFRQLPGYANAEYVIVSFDVRFADSPLIYTEQFTLERVPALSTWRLVAYFMSTKPFYLYE
ncbi:DUF4019 domain-containing protein [Burkholderia ubonensis]|uniref:DUF4019 domain-containing protein n=1 Tax=Burkholderia ubonensis TaxID=101571 RepID=UPI0012FC6E02|nr:DUF4019 domain-containing protein [Burkholderia ubonensis]